MKDMTMHSTFMMENFAIGKVNCSISEAYETSNCNRLGLNLIKEYTVKI